MIIMSEIEFYERCKALNWADLGAGDEAARHTAQTHAEMLLLHAPEHSPNRAIWNAFARGI